MELSNAVVLITGAGGGIGGAVAAGMRRRGATVVTTDLPGRGADVDLDVVDREAVRRVVDDIVAEHGRLDVVVANAGIAVGGLIEDMDDADWERMSAVNITGAVNTVLEGYRAMRPARRGAIVVVASLAGLAGPPLLGPYAMTKHAMVGLATSLRPEAARHGIGVTVVCPGPVETPLLEAETRTEGVDIRRYLIAAAGPVMGADRLAKAVCRGVERNRPIVVPGVPAVLWRVHRFVPGVVAAIGVRNLRRELELAGAASGSPASGAGPAGTGTDHDAAAPVTQAAVADRS